MSALKVATAALLATGCYGTLPPHLGEGTAHLEPGQVNLSVGAGGAPIEVKDNSGNFVNSTAAGLEVRSRVGIGAKSEIGVSVFGGFGTAVTGDPPFALGGKLSYKFAPLRRLAFVIDGGGLVANVAAIGLVGGDVAVIVAPYLDDAGRQLYVAAKAGFIVPTLQNATNVNEVITVPIGFQLPTSERVGMNIEGGPIFGFAQQTSGGATSSTNAFGGYAALTFTFRVR